MAAAIAAGGLLAAGSAPTRSGVFDAGMASAEDPRYTVVPQRERLAARAEGHAPTITRWHRSRPPGNARRAPAPCPPVTASAARRVFAVTPVSILANEADDFLTPWDWRALR